MDAFTNCNRKQAFPDKKSADAALAGMKRAIHARGEKVQGNPVTFKCKTCYGSWHIGRKNGRRGR
jgi:hypothetical protein